MSAYQKFTELQNLQQLATMLAKAVASSMSLEGQSVNTAELERYAASLLAQQTRSLS